MNDFDAFHRAGSAGLVRQLLATLRERLDGLEDAATPPFDLVVRGGVVVEIHHRYVP